MRHGLNRDLGFRAEDRVENVRRVAEVARLMADAGLVVLVALISPFRAERAFARSLLPEGEFIEVFVDAPLSVAEARDPKGLYARARRGELANLTGIDSSHEVPLSPEMRVDGQALSAQAACDRVIELLLSRPIDALCPDAGRCRAGERAALIAVDTHLLVRLLVGDDPSQAAKAQKLFDRAAAGGVSVWVSDTVLVELAWTLGRAYSRDRSDIVKALRALSSHGTVALESPAEMGSTTDAFELGPADFPGCLLSAKAQAAGCNQLATFDRGVKGLLGVKLL